MKKLETKWAFRLRFRIYPTSGLSIFKPKVSLYFGNSVGNLELEVWPPSPTLIKDSEWLVISGCADCESEAWNRGLMTRQMLQHAFAKLRVAVDFGNTIIKGSFPKKAEKIIYNSAGQPILNDEHGLVVFPTKPMPRFECVLPITVKLSAQEDRIRAALIAGAGQEFPLTEKEKIAYNLFATSFSSSSADARLIALVMAIESLFEQRPRSSAACSLINKLIEKTRTTDLNDTERNSVVGGLEGLHNQSIRASGKAFIGDKLGNRTYGGIISAQDVWLKAYQLRGKRVHAKVPLSSSTEVNQYVGYLEEMVSDLLSGPLRDVNI